MGSSLPAPASSRLAFPRTVRPESTPCWPTPWESSSSSLQSTRWTLPSLLTASPGLRRSRRRCLASLRRSDTTPLLSHSSPSPGGTETTCCRPVPTWAGTRDGLLSARKAKLTAPPSLRPSTPSFPLPDQLTSPSDCPSRTFTKLEALEQFQWAVSRLASSSPVCSSLSPPTSLPLRLNPWRCTTSLSLRPPPETTLDSTSRTCQLRTLREDMSPLTPRTTPDRFPTDTPQSWIVTPLTLLASLPKSRRRLTFVPVSPLRTVLSSSSLETLLSSSWSLLSQCVLRLSALSLPWEGSLSVT